MFYEALGRVTTVLQCNSIFTSGNHPVMPTPSLRRSAVSLSIDNLASSLHEVRPTTQPSWRLSRTALWIFLDAMAPSQQRFSLASRELLGEYAGTVPTYRRGARSRTEVPWTIGVTAYALQMSDPCSSGHIPSDKSYQDARQRHSSGHSLLRATDDYANPVD
ncbi:hypothetical protein BD310DRAFT_363488 [Dichomitus squalens]|uniref:Uncharacterized protein n=1 Tax=Dichomitus squalens TaxID=114155 RepID=A0A4Q9PZ31_9APHY|nr:hypothetical protein BD310DRAFT_363488 [Dichomitus squalens]